MAASVLARPSAAQAVPVSYTLDPTQSFVTFTGWILSPAFPWVPQIDSSETAFIQGTIAADSAGGVLTTQPGTVLDLLPHPFAAAFLPNTLGVEGNIAVQANTLTVVGANILVVQRDFVLTILAGGTMTNGTSANITVQATAGVVEWNFLGGPGEGYPAFPNDSLGNVSLSNDGLVETLIIPIRLIKSGPATDPYENVYTGQLVATRPIPEPSTIALGLLAGAGLLVWRRRWRR